MGRNRHDGAGSIPHQDIVATQIGIASPLTGLVARDPQEHACLARPWAVRSRSLLPCSLLQISLDLTSRGGGREGMHQEMFGASTMKVAPKAYRDGWWKTFNGPAAVEKLTSAPRCVRSSCAASA